MKQKKPASRPKDRSETESRLLAAAKDVFSEHGYDGATTRMVSEKSGVNLGLIARYFGNKHGLLLAVVKAESQSFRKAPVSYPPQKTMVDECLKFAESRFSLYMQQIDFFRIVLVQLITDRDFAKTLQNRDFLESETEIAERLAPYFRNPSGRVSQSQLTNFVDNIERFILSAVVVQHVMAGEPKDKCLSDLKSLVTTYCEAIETKGH